MSNQVYANGMQVSCKQAAGKSICAFPDVCMTPPQTPATPPGVPIPYPNTGLASDTSDGTASVQISRQEAMLKNKSFFKKSTGDEAGCAPKKGLMTGKNTGKVYFTMWSMDVKFEGENVVRHFDLTTHNHASQVGESPPMLHQDSMISGDDPDCQRLSKAMNAEVKSNLPRSMRPRAEGSAYGPSCVVGVSMVRGSTGGLTAAHSMIATNRITRGGQFAHYADSKKRLDDDNKPVQSDVKPCGSSEPFVYRDDPAVPTQGHAEAKLIERWAANGAVGTLVIRTSRKPCDDCTRLINEVNKGKDGKGNCNKVKVCDDFSGEATGEPPRPPPKPK